MQGNAKSSQLDAESRENDSQENSQPLSVIAKAPLPDEVESAQGRYRAKASVVSVLSVLNDLKEVRDRVTQSPAHKNARVPRNRHNHF